MQIVELLERRTLLSADAVTHWNTITINILRNDATLPGPTWSSRTLAMTHAAIYDAVNGIDGNHEPYLLHARAARGTSIDAAVATAAHDVLVSLYPAQRDALSSELADSLDDIPDGRAKRHGIAFGQSAADAVLRARRRDGSGANPVYLLDHLPGHWEPDPLNPSQTALGAGWGSVKPFVMTDGQQFRPAHPPALDSAAYAASFDEVKSLGSLNSMTRTAEQTEIGVFWGYDRPGMGTPPGLYNQIMQVIAEMEGNTIVENARLFLLGNLAQADAGIAAWDCKYVDNLWRPVTAIRRAAEDGNPATLSDTSWEPLGAPGSATIPNFTPPFPAYVSGHATFGATIFKTLELFYGTDAYSFTLHSDELPGVARSYTSFSQASAENARSRIYLGIHWSFDDEQGRQLGQQIGQWVFANIAQPRTQLDGGLDQSDAFATIDELDEPATSLDGFLVDDVLV